MDRHPISATRPRTAALTTDLMTARGIVTRARIASSPRSPASS
jgi:hypothetical protein